MLDLIDTNYYATVNGGIYPETNTDAEVVRGFPFNNVTNGTTKTTDASGVYSYGSGTATSTGGKSIPKMGATDFGHRLARRFGLKVTPRTATVLPFTDTRPSVINCSAARREAMPVPLPSSWRVTRIS